MPSPNQFDDLMKQYSSEAADEQERQSRVAQRRKLVARLIKVFIFLVIVAAGAAAFLYRAEINAHLTKLKMPSRDAMKADREAKAKAKAGDVQALGQKRVDEFEATLK